MAGYRPNKVTPGSVMEPDTFWDLVERLLLHSSKKQHPVQNEIASLTALCRGHALPQSPRQSTTRQREHTKRLKPLTTKQQFCKCQNVPPECVAMANTRQSMEQNGNEENCQEQLKTTPKGILKSNNRADDQNEQSKGTIKTTKSECQMNELDVEYINEAGIPASERLWRYAMRNKKKSELNSLEEEYKVIPNARSNEAIYRGLKKRIDDEQAEAERRKVAAISENSDRKHHYQLKGKQQQHDYVVVDTKDKVANNKESDHQVTAKAGSTSSLPETTHLKLKEPIEIKQAKSVPVIPTHITRQLQCKRPHVRPIQTGVMSNSGMVSEFVKQDINASRAMYEKVIKKRLTCGDQLESLNKELMKPGTTRYVVNNDTMRKYNHLKSDYLNLCYQESQLRHEIAVLHAEIYMMQNKGFHKRPAAVKTITLDSKTARLHAKNDVTNVERYQIPPADVPLFPPLKAPKPHFLSPRRAMAEIMAEKHPRKSNTELSKNISGQFQSDYECSTLTSGDCPPKSICAVYSLTPDMIPLPKQTPGLSVKAQGRCSRPLTHRLPRMRPNKAFNY